MKRLLLLTAISFFTTGTLFAQVTDIVPADAITLPVHKANIGRIVFTTDTIPTAKLTEADFLKEIVLTPKSNLSMRAFMGKSLTNYQHLLAPNLTVEQLNQGNYQFTFYVDGKQIYQENLHKGAGYARNKNGRTTLSIKLISTLHEDMWSRYMFTRFMVRGGEDALTTGTHTIKIELRPYVSIPEVIAGDLIAQGELKVIVPTIEVKDKAIQPIAKNSGWRVSAETYDKQLIMDLNEKILQNKFKSISGIVVIKNGKLLIEEYFNGSGRDTLHDPRSVGKTFAAAIMGTAINDGYIKSEQQMLKDFYDLKAYNNYSPQKDSVTIKSLLTMSSVFDANDNSDDSPGNENNMYPTENWVKFALDLKTDSSKRAYKTWNYFTAGIVVLGDILNKKVPGGLYKYADAKLFKPLGITNYKWQYTPQNVPNTAGGIRLRAVDFAKFGQLYKNNGMWNGKQIIPQSWVQKSFTKQIALPADVVGPGYYGYLFWNKTYTINNNPYETWYCTGNGGNKIFVFKNAPLVIIITSTAYNEGYAHPQVDKMMQEYILPAVLK
ncbi:class C beta-lactamase-related serine hydrolase [Mucilaginibacter terrigena]|uniref:Class C beta-lactamase-related serine hydrolase n=1 Tax=Mucilaginibacter terrigena TaxID=2492395 RepID=A0A4Q5LGJ2_9SPHI|nr:serine hydrolase [Mucilaginibacter terrigena]RYU85637.1 class C beta-lactamase-related serine hydrolase [Mucilaginibacter terrigena]